MVLPRLEPADIRFVKAIAFIESNTTGNGRDLVSAAWKAGLTPFLLTRQRAIYGKDGLGAVTVDVNTLDSRQLMKALAKIEGLHGVWSSSDYSIATASRVSGRLKLPSMGVEAVRRCNNKFLQRSVLKRKKIRQPEFLFFRREISIEQCRAIGRPWIVKPIRGSGKVGVRLAETPEVLRLHAAHLLSRDTNERGERIPCGVMIEEYVDGPEYSAEIMNGRCVAISEKKCAAPCFIEESHFFPAILSGEIESKLRSESEHAVHALNLTSGPVHVELRVRDGKAYIIEVNPRLAGGCIPKIIKWSGGPDLIEQCLEFAVGERVEAACCTARRYASVGFVMLKQPGTFHVHPGWSLDEMPSIVECGLFRQEHTPLDVCGDFRDRLGFVISAADCPRQCVEDLRRALENYLVLQ